MRDKITIELDSKKIEHFISYSIATDIFAAGAEFSFSFPSGLVDPKAGDLIKVFVNDKLELSGILDSVEEDDAKDSRSISVSGRDVAGLLVDSYIEDFKSLNGKTLEEITKKLISPVDILNRSDVIFEDGSSRYNISKKFAKPDIGQTIADFLSRIAVSKRMLFFANQKGEIVFGKIPTDPSEDFKIYRSKEENFRNVFQAKRSNNISAAYSEVRLYSQSNGGTNTKSTFKRDDFPIRKIFVGNFNEDEDSAKEQARAIIESQRKDSFSLEYVVPGHSQNRKNWEVRKGVRVEDERFGIKKTLLVASRIFEGKKGEGQITRLKLIEYAER